MLWFNKQEIDMVTIPTAAWANNTASDVFNKQANKDTRSLLNSIGNTIKMRSNAGKMDLHIDARWLQRQYKTPYWILYDNVEKALAPYGYNVTKGTCLNYYINIKWGKEPECPDLKPSFKMPPMPKKDDGE